MKKIAISQSNYIPWKGYFDIIKSSDEFVIYDEMQYTKNDWRNRNTIKTPNSLQWLTIPVKISGLFGQKINETKVANQFWRKKHWKALKQNYSKSKYFNEYASLFEDLYLNDNEDNLSVINFKFIKLICQILDIKTKITWSKDYDLVGEKSEKVLNICKQLHATDYVSGPSAKNYLNEEIFKENNINIIWMDYSRYKNYTQLNGDFVHTVSVLDLIFNEGGNAIKYI